MKKIAFLSLLILGASCSQVKQQPTKPAPINVMSFNIRYDNPESGQLEIQEGPCG